MKSHFTLPNCALESYFSRSLNSLIFIRNLRECVYIFKINKFLISLRNFKPFFIPCQFWWSSLFRQFHLLVSLPTTPPSNKERSKKSNYSRNPSRPQRRTRCFSVLIPISKQMCQ